MKNNKLTLVLFLTLVSLFISCSNENIEDSESNFLNNDLNFSKNQYDIDNLIERISVFDLSSSSLDELVSTVEFDENGRVVSFNYTSIYNELPYETYISFLATVTQSPNFELFDGNDDLIHPGDDSGPKPQIFHDKRNWKRPGCLRHSASICVLYL